MDGQNCQKEDTTPAQDMECSIYQNYTASEVFVQGLAGLVNQQDVESMIMALTRRDLGLWQQKQDNNENFNQKDEL